MYQRVANSVTPALKHALKNLGLDPLDMGGGSTAVFKAIEPPREWGLTFILPKLSKTGKLPELAKELSSLGTLPEIVERCEAEGIYLNLYFSPSLACSQVLRDYLSFSRTGDALSTLFQAEKPRERVMIEFSQPNTHKEFHVGHLRNVLLGNALANLYEFFGHPVVRANYYGDHGIHVAKTLWALKKFHRSQIPKDEEPALFLAKLYSEAEKILREKEGTDEAKQIEREHLQILAELSDESSETYALWLKTRDFCLQEFRRIYAELGVNFDVEFYESEMEKKGKAIVEELLEKKVAKRETKGQYAGTVFVDFADERFSAPHLGKMVLIRSDGTSLYQTKELALAKEKFTRSFTASDGSLGGIDISLYVVGSEQKLYFQQLFKILSGWGFPQAKNCKHIAYELVQLSTGKMSSREGTVIAYRDFINEAISRAKQITEERGISTDKENVARMVAVGAVKYAFLKVGTDKTIVFDWDTALSFDGNAGPYIQYAHARARKLIRDFHPARVTENILPGQHAPLPEEIFLCRVLADFPDKARLAFKEHSPAILCNYLYDLTKAFTAFYDACPVLSAPEPLRTYRQVLVFVFDLVLSLVAGRILGIELPDEM